MRKLIKPSLDYSSTRIYIYESGWNQMRCGICVTPYNSWPYPNIYSDIIGWCPKQC